MVAKNVIGASRAKNFMKKKEKKTSCPMHVHLKSEESSILDEYTFIADEKYESLTIRPHY